MRYYIEATKVILISETEINSKTKRGNILENYEKQQVGQIEINDGHYRFDSATLQNKQWQ
jgi:hypothetical protein